MTSIFYRLLAAGQVAHEFVDHQVGDVGLVERHRPRSCGRGRPLAGRVGDLQVGRDGGQREARSGRSGRADEAVPFAAAVRMEDQRLDARVVLGQGGDQVEAGVPPLAAVAQIDVNQPGERVGGRPPDASDDVRHEARLDEQRLDLLGEVAGPRPGRRRGRSVR